MLSHGIWQTGQWNFGKTNRLYVSETTFPLCVLMNVYNCGTQYSTEQF